MKKVYLTVLLILLSTLTIYSFTATPRRVNCTYQGIAFKMNDTGFLQKVDVKLEGEYNKKTKVFQGKLIINGMEYTQCILSSGFSWVYYAKDKRYLMGQFFSNKNFGQMTFEIENDELYNNLTKDTHKTDKLIISVPAIDRSDAIKLNNALRQYSTIGE